MGICYKIIKLKLIFVLFFLSIGLAFFMVAPALAEDPDPRGQEPRSGESYDDYFNRVNKQLPTGLGNAFNDKPGSPLDATAVQGGGFNTSATFQTIIGTILTMVIGLIGVIFLILAIYGGFKWMTAAGNEEAVEKAKKTMTDAILGLIIVLAAYALSRFIVVIFGDIVFKG